MHRIVLTRLTQALFVSLAAACSSSGGGSGGGAVAASASFNGFPSYAQAGIVYAEACFYTNHEDLFLEDLVDEEHVIPIALRIGLRGEGQDVAQITLAPQDMNLRLYLQDGTALAPIAGERVADDQSDKVAARIIERSLNTTLLGKWDSTREGFVFFQARPTGDFSIDGTRVVHRDGKTQRVLDLSRSLVAFNVTMKDELVPFYVGVTRQVRAVQGK